MFRRRISLFLAFIMVFSLFVFENSATVSAATSDGNNLIDLNTVWKYLDDGSDPAGSGSRTSWTLASFDDSKWKSSEGKPAKFGAQAGKLATFSDGTKIEVLLNQYLSDGKNVPTYFFRTELNLTSIPADATTVVCSVNYDDALIVYVNGTKVGSFYEPTGGFASNLSYGGSGLGTPLPSVFTFDSSLLKKGKNIIAVELHQANPTSSDVYFDMPKLTIGSGGQTAIALNVGANESERILTWRFPSNSGSVEYAIADENGNAKSFKTVKATSTVEGNTYIHTAKITDLKPDSKYIYRLVNDKMKSDDYQFKTDKTDSFNFLFVSDPQLGASGNSGTDTLNWQNTVRVATQMFPETSFLVAAGDQVESGGNDAQFLGFLSPEQMTSLAVAPTVGNHETYGDTQIFTKYFNFPNSTINGTTFGTTSAGYDYWYRYNNALFIHLNDNNLSAAEHKIVIDQAMSENEDATWRIIVMHQSMFSGGGNHIKDPLIKTRSQLVPLFVQYDIDVVLSGHDHVYSRSHIMSDGFTVNASTNSSVTDPNGILYLTAGSSSGSKFYGLLDSAQVPHAAKSIKSTVAFTNIEVTENSFELTTYRTNDKLAIDNFKIIKDKQLNDSPKTDKNIAYNEPYDAPVATEDADAFLNDGMSVALYDNEKNWYAISDKTNALDGVANIDFDFDTLYDISSVRVHLLSGSTSKLLLEKYGTPEAIELYSSNDGKNFNKIGNFKLNDAKATPTAYWTEIETNITARYIRVCVKLQNGARVLLNEIEVLGKINEKAPTPEEEPTRENIALNKQYETGMINSSYPDEGKKSLTDGVVSTKDSKYSDASWAGFNKGAADYKENEYAYITIDLGENYNVDEFKAYLATRSQGAGIKSPDLLEIYVSGNKTDWEFVGRCIPFDDHESLTTVATVKSGSPKKARYVQFRLSSEYSNWLMVSEVEVFGSVDDFMLGDLNGDKIINSHDYIRLKRYIMNTLSLNQSQLKAADINHDNIINKYDYIYIKRHIMGTYKIEG